jgi:predicted ATP-dependent serine protease
MNINMPDDPQFNEYYQRYMKCLKLKKMSVKGVAKEANTLKLEKVVVVDSTQGIYKCEGYGPEPEQIQMKPVTLVFTEKRKERTEFLIFQVNAIAKGFKLHLPNLPALALPAK